MVQYGEGKVLAIQWKDNPWNYEVCDAYNPKINVSGQPQSVVK